MQANWKLVALIYEGLSCYCSTYQHKRAMVRLLSPEQTLHKRGRVHQSSLTSVHERILRFGVKVRSGNVPVPSHMFFLWFSCAVRNGISCANSIVVFCRVFSVVGWGL